MTLAETLFLWFYLLYLYISFLDLIAFTIRVSEMKLRL